jgi:hypothetical protein
MQALNFLGSLLTQTTVTINPTSFLRCITLITDYFKQYREATKLDE